MQNPDTYFIIAIYRHHWIKDTASTQNKVCAMTKISPTKFAWARNENISEQVWGLFWKYLNLYIYIMLDLPYTLTWAGVNRHEWVCCWLQME